MRKTKVPDAEKIKAVNLYLAGKASLRQLAEIYAVSMSSVRQWIRNFESMGNNGVNFKSNSSGGSVIMNKGRKTTFDERIEIVEYCIAHDKDYTETAEKYGVSYQQARSYTIKYEMSGVEGLKDGRDRHKSEDEMNELEKLRAENRILRAQKKHVEMEASFLKKLAEIEMRRG